MTGSKTGLCLLSLTAAVSLAACTGGSPAAPDLGPASDAVVAPAQDGASVVTANSRDRGRGTGPIVFVTSQGLYYDSIVTADPLPYHGDFQKLEGTPPYNLYTTWGPGDKGYRGGRWWLDVNGNGVMDAPTDAANSDHYFSCPLLGPGREEKFE